MLRCGVLVGLRTGVLFLGDGDAGTRADRDTDTHARTGTRTGTGKCAICAECRSQPI